MWCKLDMESKIGKLGAVFTQNNILIGPFWGHARVYLSILFFYLGTFLCVGTNVLLALWAYIMKRSGYRILAEYAWGK